MSPSLFNSTYRVVGVDGLHPQFSQHPDAVGEFDRLVQHVLSLYGSLGYGEDINALQLVGGCVCEVREIIR